METSFSFIGYKLNKQNGEITFSYQLATSQKTYTFTEILRFQTGNIIWEKIPDTLIANALDNLLLILGISYWKLTCSKIELSSLKLSREQAIFWETIYTKGLGEFFYKNKIDFVNLIHFPFEENTKTTAIDYSLQNRSLLFFGGGKDSIVASGLLEKQKKDFTAIVVNPTNIHKETLKILHKDNIFFSRIIDPQIFELNKQNGFYNGHVPATAINDFIGIFAAIIYDYKYIISSNEKSANYGNVEYLGQEINHQWSKSVEFENLFSEYVKTFVLKDIIYFSLLRPLSEIKIAEIFSAMPEYFFSFSSCNKNFKLKNPLDSTKHWCCECPKCLFVFILLSAFLPKEKLISIFGKNLFTDEQLLPMLKELLGMRKIKPFECVGTPEETILAMFLTEQKVEYDTNTLMNWFKKEALPVIENPEVLQNKLLSINKTNNIPEEFKNIIALL